MKDYVIITRESKPIKMLEVKSIKESKEVLALLKECQDNAKDFEIADNNEKIRLAKENDVLIKRIDLLEQKNKIIEAELKFNRGEIEESEYLEICNGNK